MMNNFDVESNCSYKSDSLQSNSSSLSGLSLYQTEFVELRHLIYSSKYPTSYFNQNSTLKAEVSRFDNEGKDNFQKTPMFSGNFKTKLQNFEKKTESNFYSKIEKLLRYNSRLEEQLENANSQIGRLLKYYNEKSVYVEFKKNIDLEKQIHELNKRILCLQTHCDRLRQENNEANLENKNLKISSGDLLIERDVKNTSIQSLKEKISGQHVELQNYLKNVSILMEKVTILARKLEQSDKSIEWYKDQLHICQNEKQKFNDQLLEYKIQINMLYEKCSHLKIESTKCKNEVDQMKLQALKEDDEVLIRLTNKNLGSECLINVPHISETNINSNFSESHASFYDLTIQDLNDEILSIKRRKHDRDEEFNQLKQENSILIATSIMLQKNLQQNELSTELLENSKKELEKKLEYVTEKENQLYCENLYLKNKITELEIEVKTRNQEKKIVENLIKRVREQFYKFKENYSKVRLELNEKNKQLLQVQKEKQELFMSNNWTICELEKNKGKDIIIETLKNNISSLEEHVDTFLQQNVKMELQMLEKDKELELKENIVKEKIKDLENYDIVLVQYKHLLTDYENKINSFQKQLKEVESETKDLEKKFQDIKVELKKKDIDLDIAIKHIESKNYLEDELRCKVKDKDLYIDHIRKKLKKLEDDYNVYLNRNTDDKKVELLLNNKGLGDVTYFPECLNDDYNNINNNIENTILNLFLRKNSDKNICKILLVDKIFDKLNIGEFENMVDIRLKFLGEKVQQVKNKFSEFKQKVDMNHSTENRIKELEILLQVKERTMKEKQKKFDRNNRTLLHKVKEHMKGRNSAEKEVKYLRDLYNSLSDNHNSLELSISSKDSELDTLRRLCEQYKNESEKFRNSLLILETQLCKSKFCESCRDLNETKEKLVSLEEVKGHQEVNRHIEDDLKDSKENLQQLNSELHFSNVQLKVKHVEKLEDIGTNLEEEINEKYTESKRTIDNLKYHVLALQNEINSLKNDKFFLQRLSNDLKVALRSYLEDNKNLKQQLSILTKEKLTFSSLPLPFLHDISISGKYDEKYIKELLDEYRAVTGIKPSAAEFESCLSKLREEIFNLHAYIAKKNTCGEL